MATWEKQPAIAGKSGGCLNCGPRPDTFPMDGRIGVGFGMAALTRDGSYVAGEKPGMEWDDLMTGAQAEAERRPHCTCGPCLGLVERLEALAIPPESSRV